LQTRESLDEETFGNFYDRSGPFSLTEKVVECSPSTNIND